MSDLLNIGKHSEGAEETWIPLERHTGKFPTLGTQMDNRRVCWKAPSRVEDIDFLKDGELLVLEQAKMLIRSMKDQNQRCQMAVAQGDLFQLCNRLTSMATQEPDDAAELADIEASVEHATHELRAQYAKQEAIERRAAELQDELKHLKSLVAEQMGRQTKVE